MTTFLKDVPNYFFLLINKVNGKNNNYYVNCDKEAVNQITKKDVNKENFAEARYLDSPVRSYFCKHRTFIKYIL